VHYGTTMQALEAGLHVFCEKPLATNFDDAQKMTTAAQSRGVVNGVNLTYRNVSALQMARSMIEQGRIGHVRHVEASYLQSWLTQPAWGDWQTDETWLWRLSTQHGSTGVLGDVGIHILDFATFAAGLGITQITADLQTFDKAPGNQIADYVLDANDNMAMTCRFDNGATGVVHASRVASGPLNDLSLSVFGTNGGIRISNQGDLGACEICEGDDLPTASWKPVALDPVETNYKRFRDAVIDGGQMSPDFATATRLQAVIDGAFNSSQSGCVWKNNKS